MLCIMQTSFKNTGFSALEIWQMCGLMKTKIKLNARADVSRVII